MANAFDDFSRSKAVLCLMLMHKYDLLMEDEIRGFTDEVQQSLEEVSKNWNAH